MPILQIIKGQKMCNVLVIVTRYFGGILLGTGGLVRAYSDASKKAFQNAKIIKRKKGKKAKITVEYGDVERLKYYCRKNKINILKEEYLDNIEILIEISNEMCEKLKQDNDKLIIKMTKFEILEDKYIKTNITV